MDAYCVFAYAMSGLADYPLLQVSNIDIYRAPKPANHLIKCIPSRFVFPFDWHKTIISGSRMNRMLFGESTKNVQKTSSTFNYAFRSRRQRCGKKLCTEVC